MRGLDIILPQGRGLIGVTPVSPLKLKRTLQISKSSDSTVVTAPALAKPYTQNREKPQICLEERRKNRSWGSKVTSGSSISVAGATQTMRRHGWQLPLHPLQIVAMAVFVLLVVPFYILVGPFLGNRVAENTVITVFSFAAISVIVLFIRCTAIDPSDRTSVKKRRASKKRELPKLNYRFILTQFIRRFFRRMENKIYRCFLRRRYLDTGSRTSLPFETLLPFPLVLVDDAVTPNVKDEDFSYCSLCDLEVKMNSKHCRSCDRCVEGFDHHCRWLNNCIGKKNYTTFILLMVFVLLMLIIEGSSAIAIFIRCLADRKGVAHELHRKLHAKFPTGVLIGISVMLALLSAYSLAALGQLFFFHVVLIRKGMRTYDYIMAMKEENEQLDPFDELDSSDSDGSIDFDSPRKRPFLSRFFCRGGGDEEANQGIRRLSIRVDSSNSSAASNHNKKVHFQINPWKLLKMSKEKALQAAEKAREKMRRQKQPGQSEPHALKPLPSEVKHGPLAKVAVLTEITPVITKGWFPGSPVSRLSSPRRRFSWSPSPRPQKYRSNFDLKLMQVSRELESHISGQVLCSVLKEGGKDGDGTP